MHRFPILPRLGLFLAGLLLLVPAIGMHPLGAEASASLSVSGASTVKKGENISITITVNTGGVAANAFEGSLSYPTNLFDGVRGTFSGSICSLPITQPEPSGGTANFSCGTPSGYTGTGTVATIVLTAKASGTGSFGLSGCSVLANDGLGTDITGGCSGRSITVSAPPAATAVATAKPTPKPTTRATQTPKAVETPTTPKPTPTAATPTPPPVVALQTTPTPANKVATPTPSISATPLPSEKRTIAAAFQDFLASLNGLKSVNKDTSGLVALILALIPALALLLGIVFLIYRLYHLERRRRRTLDRLFEMELSELSALEGKMDLLAEKGPKGREQYREEFQIAKENILRQIRPDYGKPVETPKK